MLKSIVENKEEAVQTQPEILNNLETVLKNKRWKETVCIEATSFARYFRSRKTNEYRQRLAQLLGVVMSIFDKKNLSRIAGKLIIVPRWIADEIVRIVDDMNLRSTLRPADYLLLRVQD